MFKIKNINDPSSLLMEKEENKSLKNEQKCKCVEQVFCESSDPRGFSKSINSKQDVTLDQINYLCSDKESEKVQTDKNESIQENNNYHSQELESNVDQELEKIVKIVQEKLNEDLRSKGKKIISFDSEFIKETSNTNDSFNSLENLKNEFETDSTNFETGEFFSEESDYLVLNSKQINCHKYSENNERTCESKGQKIQKPESKSTISGQEIKICKRRERINLHSDNYDNLSCLQDSIGLFKLDYVGKSEEIGKWGLNSVKNAEISKSACHFQVKNGRRIFFPNSICIDNFDNVDRFHEIRNHDFSVLCRKLMRWTNCITKTLNKTKKFPHVVVHLPSFACPNEFRCRAEKTYQSLQNIQIGRLGWLENKASQVLYICPDDMNLDISLIQKLVTLVRPDVNLNNLWIIKAEKNNLKGKCMSGCENLFSTPATYRRVRYLTAGRQAFIVPGILSEMDVLVACELKMAILGPCLSFQNRLLNKNYTMNILYEAKIKQPPFIGVVNLEELYSNLAKVILMHPVYKLWFIKINFGHCGYQTAFYRINKKLRNKVEKFLLSEKELESILAVTLHKDIQCKKEIYEKSKYFFDDLELYGGIVQACPNEEYHVISLGLLNEHDTAEPLLIATADVIKLKNDLVTNIGYIIPQSKISQRDIEKLSKEVGEALLQEQYIGFFGIDIISFENERKVQELWVVNVNPYYTDLLSFNDWKLFCCKQCSCCPSTKVEKKYAICSGKLYNSGLSKYCGEELIAFCGTYYDHKEKSGCILCPIEYSNKAIFLFSMNSNRTIAIKKFTETLRILTKLSLEIPCNKLQSNMSQLARELEKNELYNFAK